MRFHNLSAVFCTCGCSSVGALPKIHISNIPLGSWRSPSSTLLESLFLSCTYLCIVQLLHSCCQHLSPQHLQKHRMYESQLESHKSNKLVPNLHLLALSLLLLMLPLSNLLPAEAKHSLSTRCHSSIGHDHPRLSSVGGQRSSTSCAGTSTSTVQQLHHPRHRLRLQAVVYECHPCAWPLQSYQAASDLGAEQFGANSHTPQRACVGSLVCYYESLTVIAM